MDAIFHLSFPVRSLAASLAFYEACFDARSGRRTDNWVDVILFGHQLTLHELPAQVLPREARGVRHFGAIVSWEAFDAVRLRIERARPGQPPQLLRREAGQPGEHRKLLIEDPDANLIEIKCYRTVAPTTLQPDLPHPGE